MKTYRFSFPNLSKHLMRVTGRDNDFYLGLLDGYCRSIIDIPVDAKMYLSINDPGYYGLAIVYHFPSL